MKKAQAVLAFALLAPAAALAFDTVDTLPWPSAGRFPAYPAEEDRPTDLWAHAGVMRDDNLRRLEAGEQSDTLARLGGGVRHSQRIIGRQSLRLEGRADYYRFHELSELDHLAYSALADWRWEIGNALAGSIAFGRDHRLADLGESRFTTKRMVTATRLSASGGYLVTPRLRLRAGVGSSRAERDAAAEAETRATSAVGGIEYVSPLRNTLGVEVRGTDGDAPQDELVAGVPVSNDYREREVALVATYGLGARLRFDGRVGRTTRRYGDIDSRDFEGTTWRVGAEWFPGNKTSLALAFYKEPRSIVDIAASHMVVQGASFGPSWAATAKLVFSLRLLREERRFEGDPAVALLPGAQERDETVNVLRLGIGWEPQRHWEASFAIDRGERESNFADRDYQFAAVTANLAWRY